MVFMQSTINDRFYRICFCFAFVESNVISFDTNYYRLILFYSVYLLGSKNKKQNLQSLLFLYLHFLHVCVRFGLFLALSIQFPLSLALALSIRLLFFHSLLISPVLSISIALHLTFSVFLPFPLLVGDCTQIVLYVRQLKIDLKRCRRWTRKKKLLTT